MKKLLVLSIALFTLFSCSSEDPIDPIIGSWALFSEDGEEVDDCEKQSTVTFNENNTFSSAFYFIYNNECINDGNTTATWQNEGNDNYSIIHDPEEGQEANTTDNSMIKIIFSNNNNTFTYTEIDENVTSTAVYNRVN